MKIKSSWKVTDEEIHKVKVEFAWETTLGEVKEMGLIMSKLEGFWSDSHERKIIKEFGQRFTEIYNMSKEKLKDTSVEVEIDPNPNSIKL